MFITFVTVLAWFFCVFGTVLMGSLIVRFYRLPLYLQQRATIKISLFISISWVVSIVWLLTYYVFN